MGHLDFNSQMYNIERENELADVLSHYNSEFVFNVIQNALQGRFSNNNFLTIPNVVNAWEQNFKAILDQFGNSSMQEVHRVRTETYKEIINIICKEFNLNFTVADVDQFSAANKLYQLFVCDFNELIISFFAKYIYKERNSIFDSMGLAEMKRNKDSSNLYAKRVYKDNKIATINAYIDKVITGLTGMDFDLYQIISIAISSKELVQYYIDLISPAGDFFNESIVPVLQSDNRAVLISNIRFRLHDIAMSHDQINPPDINTITIQPNNQEE